MRTIICLSALILFSATASAQDVVSHVYGVVVDENDKPVANASVECYVDSVLPTVTVKTDGDGLFSFRLGKQRYPWFQIGAVDHDRTRVSYAKRIMSAERDKMKPHGEEIPLEKIDCGTLRLMPPALIEGVVVDSDDKPVEGAAVYSLHYLRPGRTRSDADGRFTLRVPASLDIPYRDYEYEANGFSLCAVKAIAGLDIQRFGKSIRWSDGPLEELEKPLTLKLTGTQDVSVQVVDRHKKPLRDFSVRAIFLYLEGHTQGMGCEVDELPEFNVRTDEDGVARFKAFPHKGRSWEYRIDAPDEDLWHSNITFAPFDNRNMPKDRHSTVVVQRKVPVRGVVVDEDGNPVAGLEMTCHSNGVYGGRTTTDSSGNFEFRAVSNTINLILVEQTYKEPDCRFVVRAEVVVPPDTLVDGLRLVRRKGIRVYRPAFLSPSLPEGLEIPKIGWSDIHISYRTKGVSDFPPEEVAKLEPGEGQRGVGFANAKVAKDGSFEVWLPPGKYTLFPNGPRSGPYREWSLELKEGETEVRVKMQDGFLVRDED